MSKLSSLKRVHICFDFKSADSCFGVLNDLAAHSCCVIDHLGTEKYQQRNLQQKKPHHNPNLVIKPILKHVWHIKLRWCEASYNVINVIIVPTLMAPLLNIFVMIFNCWVMMLSFKWLCLLWGPCPLRGTRYASIIHWEDRCISSIFLFTWKIMLLTYFPSKRWNATFINCSSLDEKRKIIFHFS